MGHTIFGQRPELFAVRPAPDAATQPDLERRLRKAVEDFIGQPTAAGTEHINLLLAMIENPEFREVWNRTMRDSNA